MKNRWSDNWGIIYRDVEGGFNPARPSSRSIIFQRTNMKGRDGSFFEVWGILDSLRSIWQHHRASANRVDIAHRTAPTAALTRYTTLACRLPRNRREEAEKRRRRARGGACPGSAVYRWPLTLSDTEGCILRDTYGSASRYSSRHSITFDRATSLARSLLFFLTKKESPLKDVSALSIHLRESRRFIFCFSMMNGNARNERSTADDIDAASLSADILNPFVHRLELGSTYEKLKVSISRKTASFPGIDARAVAF